MYLVAGTRRPTLAATDVTGMFCAISGSVPENPVVSVKSGLLFEKTLVEKYVRETGVCPITKESLGSDDLLPLKVGYGVLAAGADRCWDVWGLLP